MYNLSDPCQAPEFLLSQAAWRTMEALADEGKLRCIGLQDASIEQLAEVMGSARILPVINSVEVQPSNRNDAVLAFCRSQVRRQNI